MTSAERRQRPDAAHRTLGDRLSDIRRENAVEAVLVSSKDNPLTIPRPLRREVPRHRLQDQRCRPWPSPLRNRLGSSLTHRGGSGVTTLQASLHVADWSVAPSRFAPHLSMTHGDLTTGTLASPRTGLPPAGCPQLVAQLRHDNLLVVMAPKLLDAPLSRRSSPVLRSSRSHLRSTAHGTESSRALTGRTSNCSLSTGADQSRGAPGAG